MRGLGLALCVGVAGALVAALPGAVRNDEAHGLAALFTLRGPRPPPDTVAIVGLGRSSVARLRDWAREPGTRLAPLGRCLDGRPERIARLAALDDADVLPRWLHACAIGELARRGARVIAVDVVFRPNPRREDGTDDLARAIAAHGRVALAAPVDRASVPGLVGAVEPLDWVAPIDPRLAAAAAAVAPFQLPRGASPRVDQFWAFNPTLSPAEQLPVASLRLMADVPGEEAAREAFERVAGGPDRHYLNLYGPAGTIPGLSLADLLLAENAGAPGAGFGDLRERLALVGLRELEPAGAGGPDTHVTVFREGGVDLSGVELAATAYANLLAGEPIRALPEYQRLLLVFALGAIATLATSAGTVWRGFAAWLGVVAAYLGGAVAAFLLWALWLPVLVPALVALPLALVAGQVVHYRGTERWLRRWVPDSVARHVLAGDDAAMRPRPLEVTVMFTDIVGFTSIAERRSEEEVRRLLEAHRALLAAAIAGEGGAIGEFTGDGVMAHWGAPDPQPDQAARACRAALAIGAALEEAISGRPHPRLPILRVRIGIHTGRVVAGDLGGRGRGVYGLVGDTVNTAQRLEQLGKVVGTDSAAATILVSERTARLAGPRFLFDDEGEQRLQGRIRVEHVFRLRGLAAAFDAAPRRRAWGQL